MLDHEAHEKKNKSEAEKHPKAYETEKTAPFEVKCEHCGHTGLCTMSKSMNQSQQAWFTLMCILGFCFWCAWCIACVPCCLPWTSDLRFHCEKCKEEVAYNLI